MTAGPAAAVLAPGGVLRAAINLGNPVLAGRDARSGDLHGLTVDLARALAAELGVPAELVPCEKAAESVEAVTRGRADVGFFAIDPQRGETIAFTPPYVLIEGCYLVRDGSPLTDGAGVDAAGHRIVVGQGSAYDLHLSRTIRHATIVRAPSSQTVVPTFLAQGCEVAAGVRQQLAADAASTGGLRLLPGRFMVIRQAMGCARSRGDEAAAVLARFVEARKASGFVQAALERHGQAAGAAVAPPGDGD